MNPRTTLYIGGARSGKSRLAEDAARASGLALRYIATAAPGDAEMVERIAHHRKKREGFGWETTEAFYNLPEAIVAQSRPDTVVLVDCLTLWLTNIMLVERDIALAREALIAAIDVVPGPVHLVSNEVGLGLVPETPLGRAFRDEQGRLNRKIAAVVPNVVFVAAGLPLLMKGTV
ncbi:MAG TPA: bifunctional adenosylcobinamide kinase/adenosylcobinamide-phosphate guanylyltransferase [Rhabdaerophilum sp.]|nr:bifunctional adenosylcobinamide kinase/adenosylcobinamide-phosphate guanylyltransferase [Rhabdaerophilum sp.]